MTRNPAVVSAIHARDWIHVGALGPPGSAVPGLCVVRAAWAGRASATGTPPRSPASRTVWAFRCRGANGSPIRSLIAGRARSGRLTVGACSSSTDKPRGRPGNGRSSRGVRRLGLADPVSWAAR